MTNKKEKNPYIAAKDEWNEVYGSYIKQRNFMAILSLVCVAITLVSVFGLVYIGSKSKFIPYTIEVDQLGRGSAIGITQEAVAPTDKNIRAQLADFITYVRSVTSDIRVQKKWLVKAYSMMGRNDASATYIKDYFGSGTGKNSPFIRLKTETVEIEVSTILKLSAGTWEIEWTETTRDKSGNVIDEPLFMRGVFQVYIAPPEKEEEIKQNPFGIFVKTVSWSKKL